MTKTQHTAIVSISFKKGDRLLHKNWRPISLLNIDYKLCTPTLAGRLLKVIHLVVSPDQTCGITGRYIGKNVALLRDVVDFANKRDLPVTTLSLDQEKVFDRVDWHFLFSILCAVGFGLLSFPGSGCFVQVFIVQSLSMATFLILFLPDVAFNKVVPCPLFCMFSLWRISASFLSPWRAQDLP